jgi:hypothetical protein
VQQGVVLAPDVRAQQHPLALVAVGALVGAARLGHGRPAQLLALGRGGRLDRRGVGVVGDAQPRVEVALGELAQELRPPPALIVDCHRPGA